MGLEPWSLSDGDNAPRGCGLLLPAALRPGSAGHCLKVRDKGPEPQLLP